MRNIPLAIAVLEFCGASVFTIPFNTLKTLVFGLFRRAPSGCVKQCGSDTGGCWNTIEMVIFCRNNKKE